MYTILVDVDGVVSNLVKECLGWYNRDWNDKLKYEQIVDWDIAKFVKPECGKKFYDYFSNPDIYNCVEEIQDSKECIQTLRGYGYKIIYLTSGFFPAKAKWLYNHGYLTSKSWEYATDIVVTTDKSLIKADLLIDDGYHNIVDWHPSLLFTQPWNKKYMVNGSRVDNWSEIVRKIKEDE